jgi:hypothetical protein
MNKYIANTLGSVAIGALCVCGWAAAEVALTVEENRPDIRATVSTAKTGVADVFSESRDVTIALLKPCKAGKPETCGLLPAVQQVASSAGTATQAASQEIQQTQPLIQNAALAVSDMSAHLDKVTDAATAATVQAQRDLATLNGSIGAAKPLLDAFTADGQDLDTAIKSANAQINNPVVADFEKHVDGMSASGDLMLSDAQWKEHQLLHPDKVKLGFWGTADATAMWIHSHVLPPIF